MPLTKISRASMFLFPVLILLFLMAFSANGADIIVDNGNAGVSSTGEWYVSSAINAYGINSLYGAGGASYTWHANLPQAGSYDVYAWWTAFSNRTTSAPYTVTYAGGSKTISVNQQLNGGTWNYLGTFSFDASTGGTVRLAAPSPYPLTYSADAIKFSPASAEIVVDNSAPGTSSMGEWYVSSAINAYGINSVYGAGGASYTWHANLPQAGSYDVYAWWTAFSNRTTSAPYTVTYPGGSKTISVNQQLNGGMWNYLGTFSFDTSTGATVRLAAPSPYPLTYSADAIKFSPSSQTNLPPSAVIDSISPNPAITGQTVSFSGHGTDPDGTVAGYSWESSLDGHLSDSEAFTTSSLSNGDHSITFTVYDNKGQASSPATRILTVSEQQAHFEIIVDNSTPGTSSTGEWYVSSAINPYGINSVYGAGGASYTWHANLPQTGSYDVYAWWTAFSNRTTSAPYTVTHPGGSKTISVNQQLNGGMWNYLGNFSFDASTGGTVRLGAPSPYPLTYSADAVKFVSKTGTNGNTPVAVIDSVLPNPARFNGMVTFAGHGVDSTGTITGYSWRSSIDGQLSGTASFSLSSLSNGSHMIFFKVKNNSGVWSAEAAMALNVIEHIYACMGYGPDDPRPGFLATLRTLGASSADGILWTYFDSVRNKTYYIHIVTDIAGMKSALQTEGAHILFFGHSNYGLGPVFPTDAERQTNIIDNILYIDDDRIFNISSPWINVGPKSMRTSQAYPHWWPIYKDGTSGIMPYDFGDPRGDPPYNYYQTYQIPGDPTYYKVEGVQNGALERFPDSGFPAWYSPSGAIPDGTQYYVTNSAPWRPSFETSGTWIESRAVAGYLKENYLYSPAGHGENKAAWLFTIPAPGLYTVSAWWPASQSAARNAPYTIYYASGAKTVGVDQRSNGSRWNQLGTFDFDAGDYSVVLTNQTTSGNVAADGVRIVSLDNPPEVIQSDFYAKVRSGTAPFSVTFENQSTGGITSWVWDFGDGSTSNAPDVGDEVVHTYRSPGQYAVTLTISGPAGSSVRTKKNYITVGNGTPLLQAEFSTRTDRTVSVPFSVTFRNRSSGNITAWRWDFGDGTTSAVQEPVHVFPGIGNYSVSLMVTDAQGKTASETKTNFIRGVVLDREIDNVDYPKPHYGSKVILYRKELEIPKEEIRYSRMFYLSCFSGNYFTDTLNRGVKFFTVDNSAVGGGTGLSLYLTAYLEGKTNYEIWQILQGEQAVFDYYDFNKLPSEQ